MEILIVTTCAVVLTSVISAVVYSLGRRRREEREARLFFGALPDEKPEFDSISALYNEQLKKESPYADDITFADIDMKSVFASIDTCLTSAGEEMLWEQLHYCDKGSAEKIALLCDKMSEDEELRTKVYAALYSMGKMNYNGAAETVYGKPLKEIPHKWIYYFMPFAPFIGIAAAAVGAALNFFPLAALGLAMIFLPIAVNMVLFYSARRICSVEIGSAMYAACAAAAAERLCENEFIRELFPDLKEECTQLAVLRKKTSGVTFGSGSDGDFLVDMIKMGFQTEVRSYCAVRKIIIEKKDATRSVYCTVGLIDAACAVLNCRENHKWCRPVFTEENVIDAKGLYHPLIKDPVPNSVCISKNMLLTGSNASGKSSFIKACAINCILAQSIGICTAESFSLKRCRVISSMAVSDSIAEGDSYFTAELKSLRRLTDSAEKEPCICFIDEILKGTNTAERLAASESVLEFMSGTDSLCIAATHDLELTERENGFMNMHFSEHIAEGRVLFDYTIKNGSADSRNAILLMAQMGFGERITSRAEELCAGQTFQG